jgi:ribonuclease P protein component
VVASKRIGGAVERNRARRIMRVAWTHVSGKASGMDVVVVAKPTIRSAMAQDLVNEMAQLLAGTGGHP